MSGPPERRRPAGADEVVAVALAALDVAAAGEPQPPPAAAPPLTNSSGAPIPKPDRQATADVEGTGSVRQEAARLFLAGALAGYLDRDGFGRLDLDPHGCTVGAHGHRYRITVTYDGPLTDAELARIAERNNVRLRRVPPGFHEGIGITQLDLVYLNAPEPNCAECSTLDLSCAVHYHERLTVLSGRVSGSADRSIDGA